MPKQALTINDFSGGLITDISSRDLEGNQLEVCTNADPSSKGKLTNTKVFCDDDSTFDDFGNVAPQIGTGLFIFSNDKAIVDDADNDGDFIIKSSGTNQVALQEVEGTDITITDLGSLDVATAPQFYSAEGDLFIGGDHTKAPTSVKYHSQAKFGGSVDDDWLFGTQTRTAPTNDSDMDISETSDMTAATYDGANPIPGLGADELNWIIHYTDDAGLWDNDSTGTEEFIEWGGSWLYKNKAESAITPLHTGATMTGKGAASSAAITIAAWTNAVPTTAKLYIYGARLYAKKSGTGTWYLAAEVDYEKGIKGDTESDWGPWGVDGNNWGKTDASGYLAETGFITAPPTLITYDTNNGHDEADIVDTVFWKHGVIANGRAYVVNVKVGARSHGDRILRSPVFQYDVFAENSYLDVAAADGDESTALAAYGDMLLQFKQRKLYFINISQDQEYMEDVRENAGVQTAAAVCKTPFGIAWANYNGAYLYNGSDVTQLTMGKISDSDWNTNVGTTDSNTICGYDPINRQFIVLWDGASSGDGKAYVFTFDTNTWHYVSDMVSHDDGSAPDTNCTNMVNTSDGKLMIGGGVANTELLIYGSRSTKGTSTSQVDIRTGQLSLGNPGIKKNLTNVTVRYKKGGSDLAVIIITNDNDPSRSGDDIGEVSTTLSGSLTDTSGDLHAKEYSAVGTAALQGQYWFQVKIAGTAHEGFELDEVVLTYRELGVR